MEEVQEQKFQCKFCSKSCFSGKSLGGHMRGHLALISAARKKKVRSNIQMALEDGDNDHIDNGLEENFKDSFGDSAEQSNSSLNAENIENRSSIGLGSDDQDQDQVQAQESYGLRGNPKKSWKASDLNSHGGPRNGNVCKECCKRFPSARALAGHMRTHSLKLRDQHLCKKCGKRFDSMRAMYGHMRAHSKRSMVSSESADGFSDFDIIYPRKKRSVTRYKFGQGFSFCSATVSVEVEHAAMGLMMLSRGVRNWDGFNGPVEHVGNATSIKLEAKDNEVMTKVAGDGFVCDLNEVDKTQEQMGELDPCFSGSGDSFSKENASEFNDMGSEFASVLNKAELEESSVKEPPCSDDSKKPRNADVNGNELVDDPKNNKASESSGVEMPDGMDEKDLKLEDSNSYKQLKVDAHEAEFEGDSPDVAKCEDSTASEILKDSEKKREFKCSSCDKIFGSHQALGGHRNRSKLLGTCCIPSTEAGRLSEYKCTGTSSDAGSGGIAMAAAVLESNKIKEHECAICFKVFSTGQALGGHKRAHYASLNESRIRETTVSNQELQCVQNICGLNVPAIGHQVARDDVGFKLWWIGNGHVADPLLISN